MRLKDLGTVKNVLKDIGKGATNIDDVSNAVKNLSVKQTLAVLSTTNLSDKEKALILVNKGVSQSKADELVATQSVTVANNTAAASTGILTTKTIGLSTAIKGLGAAIAANPIGFIITVVTTLITIISQVISKVKESQEAAAQAAKESADAASTLSSEITELTNKYLALCDAVKTDESAKESLLSTQDELIKKLGLEQTEIDELIAKYGSLSAAIKQASIDELQKAERDIRGGLNEYEDALLDAGEPGLGSSLNMMSRSIQGKDETPEMYELYDGLKALEDAGLISSGQYSTYTDENGDYYSQGFALYFGSEDELDTIDGIIAAHERLGNALDIVASTIGSDNVLYETMYEQYNSCTAAINDYNDAINSLNGNLAQQYVLSGLIDREIPTTKESFDEYRQSVIDAAVASGKFSGSQTDIANSIDNVLREQSQFSQFYQTISGTTSTIDKVSSTLNKFYATIDKLKSAVAEYNENGQVSAETYKEIIALNEDYADLFDFSNGKIELAAENVDKLASELIEQYGATLAANGATEEQIQLMVALANSIRFVSSGFDELQNSYNSELSELDHLSNTYENAIQAMEKAGLRRTTTYYQKLKDVEEDRFDILNAELTALTAEFQNAILSGEVKEGSDEWNKMNSAINKVKESIQKAEIAVQDYSNTIRDIEWEYFDYQQQLNSQVTDESNFLLDLMSGKDMVDDKGAFTEFGNAAMGLHGVNYNVYLKQSQQYAAELAKIEAELATNPYNQDLIDRKEELLGLQRDSILAAEDEKQAMIDLVKEGIDAQCDAMKDLIDKYKEALDGAKDLYDYQNKISDITQEIGTLQKQIIAYENDTSEEAKAQIQQLKVDLQKAQEELQETEYDQFIADQKKLLDRLYNDYESILNQRLDDVDTLISDCIASINDGATEIQGTLGSLGTTLSSNMSTIWNTAGGVGSVVSTFNEDFDTKMTTVGTTLGNIETLVSNIKTNSTNNSTVTTNPDNSGGATNPTGSEITDYTPTETPTGTTSSNAGTASKTSGTYKQWETYWFSRNPGVYGPASPMPSGWQIYDTVQGCRDAIQGITDDMVADNLANGRDKNFYVSSQQWQARYRGAMETSSLETAQTAYLWLKGYYESITGKVSKYKDGGLVDYTGLAWVDGVKSKPEAFLDAEDTQNIASLRDMLRALASDNIGISNPLYSMFEPITYQGGVPGLEDKISSLSKHTETINVENHFEITIPIDKVEDYNDFVTKLQSDPKFEKMIEAMTLGRLKGGSPLAKYNYKWK